MNRMLRYLAKYGATDERLLVRICYGRSGDAEASATRSMLAKLSDIGAIYRPSSGVWALAPGGPT